MPVMKMLLKAAGAALAAGLLVPMVASADISDLGHFDDTVRGSCPGKPCFAFSRTTGYQAKVGDERGPLVAKADGRVVGFTVAFGKPGKKQTKYFEDHLGGAAQLQVTVLNPRSKLRSRALASSEVFHVERYFGSTVQFALAKSLPIKKGQVVGITSATWAPVLAVNMPSTTSWRAARPKGGCDDVSTQTAQTKPNQLAQYYCLYRGVRLAYSATIIDDPKPTTAKTSR
jgi:hypothetical protein